eukprot:TRINITY_DN16531_c0_g1_i1.p1 TRINITY_DN16531_c0_g1~~TRINITY_DN16531_c0_g1_i1.p1  ORF type:complete len:216 (-),score=25.04 TRINITY_DN16531_c0_g1_i1:259-906(-)
MLLIRTVILSPKNGVNKNEFLLLTQRCMSSSTAVDEKRLELQRKKLIDRIIRVDHAGEMGATFIYKGQMAVLGKSSISNLIKEMQEHEEKHLAKFEDLIVEYNVRPTILIPLWKLAGFTLGAGCSLLGEKGAMACTVAVEALVTKHYDDQVDAMINNNPKLDQELIQIIKQFRDDEQEHHDIGLAHGAEEAPMYRLLTAVIGAGCKGAIFLSERI